MIKAAIVGCGKIADAHAWAISQVKDVMLAASCDQEELMARQLAERFQINRWFSDIHKMLEITRPDVIHITTPPHTHFELAKISLDAGCHVYIEKPFSITAKEAEKILNLAEEKQLKVTVGTDEQFSHVAIKMRELIKQGYLGGPPVHMEVYYCYDLGDERYARSFLENQAHWLRKLPGRLMHNVISHGISKIAEYLSEEDIRVIAFGFTSSLLKKAGENKLIDELRTIIYDGKKTTAYFTFSTQMRPLLREFRVYGPKNGLILNQDHHSLIKIPGIEYKSYLNKFLPLNYFARQYRKTLSKNFRLFLKREFHMKQGLKLLVELFYRSIREHSPPPIPYREIILTAKLMDEIFSQVCPDNYPSESFFLE